jgi:site-specific DNA recombinase
MWHDSILVSKVRSLQPTQGGSVEPDEAAWVNKMADLVLDGLSLRKIRDLLDTEGAPTPPRGVGVWRYGGVREVLVNETIAGLRWDPETEVWVKAPWEPILPRDRWNEVQTVLRDPARRVNQTKQRSLLSGVAVCGKCGQVLRPTRRDGRRIYRCLKSDTRPDACQGISIAADALDVLVVDATLDLLDGVEINLSPPGGKDEDLDEIDAQLDALAADWARGDITRSEWRHAREILIERRTDTERSQQRSNPTLAALATATDIRSAWPELDIGDQRAVLRDLFDQIAVGPSKIRGDVEHRVELVVAE